VGFGNPSTIVPEGLILAIMSALNNAFQTYPLPSMPSPYDSVTGIDMPVPVLVS
jgi:hypothetical protein